MSITKMTDNLNIIQSLPDSPTQSSTELKQKFDEGANLIKTYINDILTVEIDKLIKNIQDNVAKQMLEDNKKKYYVGKIILDTKNVNPSTYLGFGVWQLWGTGRVPVGVDTTQEEFNTVEKTGGEKTHTQTVEEMPEHKHKINQDLYKYDYQYGTSGQVYKGEGPLQAISFETDINGKGKPFNIIQPYITCYMWKRIS